MDDLIRPDNNNNFYPRRLAQRRRGTLKNEKSKFHGKILKKKKTFLKEFRFVCHRNIVSYFEGRIS